MGVGYSDLLSGVFAHRSFNFKQSVIANSKRHIYPNDHSSIIYNSQDMETTYITINGWMDKEEVIYSEIDYYLAIKKMKSSICRTMDGPWGCYAKVK